MDTNLIKKARSADIVEYLKRTGNILFKEGNQFRVESFSGLVVSGNKWYSHTLHKGGNTLDYLIEIEGICFKEAVEILSHSNNLPAQEKGTLKARQIILPKRNFDDKRVIAYLLKTRGIRREIIMPLIKQGRIYEEANTHNCVFIGIDKDNTARYAMQRSTLPCSDFKFEANGSDKRYSFSITGQSDVLCVFESPIDLLSYMSLYWHRIQNYPFMLSLGGITDIALAMFLELFPQIKKIVFCLDQDKTGTQAFEVLSSKYSEKGFSTCQHSPKMKDWNLQLINKIASNS